ncbi:rod shape-determining protein MreD [Candidatus Latescibacterota bacterium]
MKYIRNLLLISLALLVQSTLLGRFDIYGVRPDLALLVLLFIMKSSDPTESIIYGFLIGFLQDVYTPEYLGFNALTMSVLAFIMGFVRERVTVEKGLVHFLVTFLACILHDSIFLTLYTHFNFTHLGTLFLTVALPGAAYTTFLSLITVMLWDRAENGGLSLVVRQLMGHQR